MQLCDDGHDQICYAGVWANECPACQALEELRESMQEKIDELQEELDEHECE